MKNSFSLLEVILTLVISSIVIIYSTLYIKELLSSNNKNQQLEINKINLISTKIFIEKHKDELDAFYYENGNLYFKNSLLLEDLKEFELNQNSETVHIKINLKNEITQNWQIRL